MKWSKAHKGSYSAHGTYGDWSACKDSDRPRQKRWRLTRTLRLIKLTESHDCWPSLALAKEHAEKVDAKDRKPRRNS
jgi:hypothetical protein